MIDVWIKPVGVISWFGTRVSIQKEGGLGFLARLLPKLLLSLHHLLFAVVQSFAIKLSVFSTWSEMIFHC